VELRKAAANNLPIHEYVNTRKQRSILLLGDYSDEGLRRLDDIAQCLTALGYEPRLVRDVPDILGTNTQQKVRILGSLARFVFVDDSSKSGHLVEVPIAQNESWITVLLHADGARSSFMTAALSATSRVIQDEDYDAKAPCDGVAKAISWAETQLNDIERQYKREY